MRLWLFTWLIAFTANAMLGWDYIFNDEIMLLVVASVFMFVLGGFSFGIRASTRQSPDLNRASVLLISVSGRWANFLVLLSLVTCFPLLDHGLRSFSSLSLLDFVGSGDRLFSIMKQNQATLYESAFPVSFKLVTMLLVIASFFVPISFISPQRVPYRKRNLLLLVTVSLLFSAVSNVRSMLLVPLLVGWFSFMASCVVAGNTRLLTSPRVIALGLIAASSFIAWVVIAQSARLEDANFERVGRTLNHIRPWFAGYIPALSVWYESSFTDIDLTIGSSLLRGILGPLGLVSGEGFDERIGAYDIGNGQVSNAMTIFRVLILDFGLVGTVIACYLWGWSAEFTYYKALTRAGSWVVALAAQYCAVFFSLNYWFFAYGARVFGFLMALIFVTILVKWARKTAAGKVYPLNSP